jgi:hypothetical protein
MISECCQGEKGGQLPRGHAQNSPEFVRGLSPLFEETHGQEHGKHQYKSGDHHGRKDAQQIIQPDIPPGHL